MFDSSLIDLWKIIHPGEKNKTIVGSLWHCRHNVD